MQSEVMVRSDNILQVQDVVERVKMVNELYTQVMKRDEHFGVIPGTQKPTLLKAGAEKILAMFNLAARTEKQEIVPLPMQGHREYIITVGLYNRKTGDFWGDGSGSCSTMESKYRYRKDNAYTVLEAPIPNDYREKKSEYRKQGYGAKKIENQWVWVQFSKEKAENPDIADIYNTVLKMAEKRALVSAVLKATGVSDIFTQDMEDYAQTPAEQAAEAVGETFSGEIVEPEDTQRREGIDALPEDIKTVFRAMKFNRSEVREYCEAHSWDVEAIRSQLATDRGPA